jgi:hypothetical protein
MGQVLHECAATTEAVRRAIQHSQESLRALAKCDGQIKRPSRSGRRATPSAISEQDRRSPQSTVLTVGDEAVVVAFRGHTLLPLDDCL